MDKGTSPNAKTIDAIRSAFGYDDPSKVGQVPKSTVLEWMRSEDLEVLGAIYAKITKAEYAAHVVPPLEFDDYYNFVPAYLERCIEHNPQGEWAASRYIAGHQLVSWLNDFWGKGVSPDLISKIKTQLADLYIKGNAEVRDALINSVLEHLFEKKHWVSFFKDWQTTPVLKDAYADALLWTKR